MEEKETCQFSEPIEKGHKERFFMAVRRGMLWLIRLFRMEGHAIPMLKTVDPEEIRHGSLYEHYGRIFAARRNPKTVEVRYSVTADSQMPEAALRMVMKGLSDGVLCQEKRESGVVYVTTDETVGDRLSCMPGLQVEQTVSGRVCAQCCDIWNLHLPCGRCDYRHYFKLVHQHPQNSTDQRAWLRQQARRLGLPVDIDDRERR